MRRAWALAIGLFGLFGAILGAHAGHDGEDAVEMTAAEQAKRLLDYGEKLLFIDLRPATEFAARHLPGARSIPIDQLRQRLQEVPKTGRVVFYCDCPAQGRDQQYVYTMLRSQRYRNVSFLEEGLGGWLKRGYPVETGRR